MRGLGGEGTTGTDYCEVVRLKIILPQGRKSSNLEEIAHAHGEEEKHRCVSFRCPPRIVIGLPRRRRIRNDSEAPSVPRDLSYANRSQKDGEYETTLEPSLGLGLGLSLGLL
jgi:hypothetical protein